MSKSGSRSGISETSTAPEQLLTVPESNQEWVYWGAHDPLFAVATLPGKDKDGESPWTPEEILETGRRYFGDVYLRWQQYGVGSRLCVEIGCGVGRITAGLASRFERVLALDVSNGQIETARRLLGQRAANVTFALVTRPQIPLSAGECDAVFSCEVFQHFDDVRIVHAYLREACRVLAPGGTICFQLPILGVHRSSFLSSRTRSALLRTLRRLGRKRMMIYRRHDASAILGTLADLGFSDVEMRVFHADTQDGYHAYFLGRR